MGEGWAHFHRDLRTEMRFDALIMDVRANGGGHTSQLVVEKLARRVIALLEARELIGVVAPNTADHRPIPKL